MLATRSRKRHFKFYEHNWNEFALQVSSTDTIDGTKTATKISKQTSGIQACHKQPAPFEVDTTPTRSGRHKSHPPLQQRHPRRWLPDRPFPARVSPAASRAHAFKTRGTLLPVGIPHQVAPDMLPTPAAQVLLRPGQQQRTRERWNWCGEFRIDWIRV